ADGGLLVLGAEDDGTPTGHFYPEEAIKDFAKVGETRLKPKTKTTFQKIDIDGCELFLFHVESTPVAVMTNGGFPYRTGDTIVRLSEEVINSQKTQNKVVSFEVTPRSEASFNDIDFYVVQEVKASTPFRDRSNEEFLQYYGLIESKNASWIVKNATLLLFGKSPLVRWHPRAGVRVFKVAGTERSFGIKRNVIETRFEGPLIKLANDVYKHIKVLIRKSEKLHNLFFKEMPEYPEFAWQEAIVNAIAHRDYRITSQEIEIWIFDNRMEIKSPGLLVNPITIEGLLRRKSLHASRNPLIVRVMVDYGLMREEGEGIPRMFEEMETCYLRLPDLDISDDIFKVTLWNTPIFDIGSPEWVSIIKQLPLSDKQKRILIATKDAGFTNSDYQEINKVDRDTAYREIHEMVEKGFIIHKGRGRAAKYFIVLPEKINIDLFTKRFPTLRSFLTKRESISNAEYRNCFQLSRHAAYDELKRLVDEDYLTLEGKGRGAKYKAGVKLFPET
ncbi:MAG: ATP-binding protein, partial [Desulfobacterales bacterium]